jgi:class 3 adenylate cyclase
MESKAVQRRLAAILAADVAGYSRLMGADEIGTLTSLKAHRRELTDPAIAAHRGRIVKTTGDGALIEFTSVVDAVACAVAIQRGMMSRNAHVSEEKRIIFRIGINVGDVIIDSDDIFGDRVNIAARLETLCEPGGVCISRRQRADQGQTVPRLRRSRRTDGQEHCRCRRRVRARLEGYRDSPRTGSAAAGAGGGKCCSISVGAKL